MENMENTDNLETPEINEEELQKEESYQKLIALLSSLECMNTTPSKAEIYLSAANKFAELEGYKDSEDYVKLCKQSAKQTNDELIKKLYDYATLKKNNAKNADDYKLAAAEFRKTEGYSDSDKQALECDKLSDRIDNKGARKFFGTVGVVLFGILVLVFIGISPVAKYNIGNALYNVNAYKYALKFYHHSGDYKDTKDKAMKCQYMLGLDYEAKGNYKMAKKAFYASGNYKESDVKKVAALKQVLKNARPGISVVKIGKYNWKVLKVEDTKVLLLKKAALPKRAYSSNVSNAAWENSDLRKYLNNNFLNDTFSKEELKNILQTTVSNSANAKYGTAGGNDTSDYLFLLDIDEAHTYNTFFKALKGRSWLRSPGSSSGSAAFITDKGLVMDFGYDVTSDEFTAIPAMWFNIQ